MLVAEPQGFWTFDLLEAERGLRRGDRFVGRVRLLPGDAAEVSVGAVPFGMGCDRRGHRFVLTFEGVEVAWAQQPAAWRRRLLVLVRGALLESTTPGAADLPLVLEAEHALGRSFAVRSGARRVGHLRPEGLFTTRAEIALPLSLPRAVQAFLFALVAVQWRRAQQQRH